MVKEINTKSRISSLWFFALGILIGFLFFLFSSFWIGTMSLSIVIVLIAGGGIIAAKLVKGRAIKKEGES